MTWTELDAIRNQLQLDENEDLRRNIYAHFLENQERVANKIAEFAGGIAISADIKEVIEY